MSAAIDAAANSFKVALELARDNPTRKLVRRVNETWEAYAELEREAYNNGFCGHEWVRIIDPDSGSYLGEVETPR